MNNIELRVVRAFTAGGQGGNPAGLVLDADHLSSPQKQAIATAAGLSETAFVSASGVASLKLEFFTPRRQIAHCGHATIATFGYLSATGRLADGMHSKETIDGVRHVRVAGGRAAMQQRSPRYSEVDAAAVLDALRLAPTEVLGAFAPTRVDTGNGFVLVGVRSSTVLAALVPDLQRIEALSEAYALVGFYVFSLAPGDGLDATARMFAPRFGIDEEAATGMAAGPLACLLYARGGPSSVRIEQGRHMPQPSPSLLEAELCLAPGGLVTDLWVAGEARLEATRRIHLGDPQ
ncbi:PhzF family phenazine biosynthesis protein [Hyalangium versicolor]|uniref:PhzF family phenazine biosynthesis protein n=1 Tax=Hyalangium versicolor TaxID=2861190 RepID=UPI001CCB5D5E|nr:PhzF family phenazine biosynthesis protein [Hyalangium versicolor]